MLHQSVANLLVHVLEGGEQRIDLQLYFLTRCNLPKRLIDSFDGASYSTAADDESKVEDLTNHSSNSMIDGKTGEKMTYSAVLAMKNFDQTSGSSSVDASVGSDATSGNETDEIPVSDDDVEVAIEQEEQLKLYHHEENEEKKTQQIFDDVYKRGDIVHSSKIAESQTNANVVKKSIDFRLGYMGHVIIICQALVHACGSIDQGQNVSTLAEEAKKENTLNDSTEKANESGDKMDTGIHPAPPIQRNIILSLLKGNRHYKLWQTFVTTTLASETAVQSTPLGGYNNQDEGNAHDHQKESPKWDEDDDDNTNQNTGNTNYVVSSGEIDLDDTDLDIAASMMESMNLPSSEDSLNSNGVGNHSGHKRHHRQRGVIGGQGIMNGSDSNGSGADFGTVVQIHQSQESGGYVYDDPLGAKHDFLEDSDDEEANGLETENNEGENDVPVMDLFAGNFDFDSAGAAANGGSDDTGWANFDDAFGSAPAEFQSSLDDDFKSPTQTGYDSQTDPFNSPNDLFGMIAESANVISTFAFSDEVDKDNRDIRKGGPIIEAEEDQ